MIFNKSFMRFFRLYRAMEDDAEKWGELVVELLEKNQQLEKQTVSDAALIESLNRYITALEGRDKERLTLIEELKDLCAQLRKHLSGVLPPDKKA